MCIVSKSLPWKVHSYKFLVKEKVKWILISLNVQVRVPVIASAAFTWKGVF